MTSLRLKAVIPTARLNEGTKRDEPRSRGSGGALALEEGLVLVCRHAGEAGFHPETGRGLSDRVGRRETKLSMLTGLVVAGLFSPGHPVQEAFRVQYVTSDMPPPCRGGRNEARPRAVTLAECWGRDRNTYKRSGSDCHPLGEGGRLALAAPGTGTAGTIIGSRSTRAYRCTGQSLTSQPRRGNVT